MQVSRYVNVHVRMRISLSVCTFCMHSVYAHVNVDLHNSKIPFYRVDCMCVLSTIGAE